MRSKKKLRGQVLKSEPANKTFQFSPQKSTFPSNHSYVIRENAAGYVLIKR